MLATKIRSNLRTRVATSQENGFTLIELLIVIIILGILAGITITQVGFARGEAVAKACQTDAVNLRQAFDLYYFDKQAWPPLSLATDTAYTTAGLRSVLADTSTGGKAYLRDVPQIGAAAATSDYYFTITISRTTGSTTVTNVQTIQGFRASDSTSLGSSCVVR